MQVQVRVLACEMHRILSFAKQIIVAGGLKADVNDTNLGAEINGNGPCRKKLNSLGDKIPIGAFVPQCKDNGNS